METNVSQLTVSELRAIIADVVEEKLAELVDGEAGLEVIDDLRSRLLMQKYNVANGERGIEIEAVLEDLDID